jgi:DNA/RNA-binding domain of Phe-tRNA-synthetase-like protein
MNLRIDPSLRDRLLLAGLVQAGISVTSARSEVFERAIRETEKEMRALYDCCTPSEIPGCLPARKLYKSIGVDPTRMRPASEALLRRVLKGGKIPSINSAVDAANLVSLRNLIPVGLYDADKIQGDIELRVGRAGEQYPRIGTGEIHLDGRLGLFDEEGGFGNPTGDSRRTLVDYDTKNLLFTAFFPTGFDTSEARRIIEDAGEALSRYTGGEALLMGDGGLIPC